MVFSLVFLARFIKHLSIMLVVSLPLQLLGSLILIPATMIWDIGHLPRCLRWFDSADPFTGRDTSVIKSINSGKSNYYPHITNKLLIVLHKYLWLAWRNPINYFEYKVLGFKAIVTHSASVSVSYQNQSDIGKEIGDHPLDAPGFEFREQCINNNLYYEYYLVYQYPFMKSKALRFRLGYKLSNTNKHDYVQQVLTLNPLCPVDYINH